MALFSEQQTAAAERYAGLGQQADESLTDYYKRLSASRAGGILGTQGLGSAPSPVSGAVLPTVSVPSTVTSSNVGGSGASVNTDYPIVNINGDRYKVVQGTDGAYLQAEDRWATGNYNIAGTSADGGMDYIGNTLGYEGNPWVATGFDLQQLSDNPLAPAWLQLIGGIAAPAMIGYDTVDINGVPTGITRGSFDVGTFTDSTPTDISGGAMGSNVARNAAGDVISVGYGYGQVDPSIAKQLGFNIDPTYNPTPEPVTTTYDDGSKSTVATDPATGIKSTTYFDADGNNIGSYTAGQGLTLTQKAEGGGYVVPSAVSQGMGDIAATNPNAQSAGLMMLLGSLFGMSSEETATKLAEQQAATNKQFADLQTQVNNQFDTVATNYKDLLSSQDATQEQLADARSSWETALAAQNDLLNQQGLSFQEKIDNATATYADNLDKATTLQEESLAKLQYELSVWQATADAERAQMGTDIANNTTGITDLGTTGLFNVADFTNNQAVIDAYNTSSSNVVSSALSTPSSSYSATATAVPDYAPNVSGMLTNAAADQAAAEAALSAALATGADAAAQQAVATPAPTTSTSSSSSSSSSYGGNTSTAGNTGGYSTGSVGSSSWGGNTAAGYTGGYGGW